MRAIILDLKILRYLLSKAFGLFWKGAYYSSFSCLSLREVPEPRLPAEDWAKIRTIYSGICASDISGLFFRNRWDSFITSFISFPIGLGHEIVGRVVQTGKKVSGFAEGDRVIISPLLPCAARGINPLCPQCRQGNYSICESFLKGGISTGTTIGNNRDTGGGWGEYLVAHASQLHKIPDEVSDEEAVLSDPCACTIHAVLKAMPRDNDKVLVYGIGTIGLCLIASLRALGSKAHITAIGRHPYQLEKATQFGATQVFYDDKNIYQEVASLTGADVVKAKFGGRRILNGGADVVFDCVGSVRTIDNSLRFCKGAGTVVLVGMGYPDRVDWHPVYFSELTIKGCIGYGEEKYGPATVSAIDIAIDFLKNRKFDLSSLITHKYEIADYREAIRTCFDKKREKQIKTLFYVK